MASVRDEQHADDDYAGSGSSYTALHGDEDEPDYYAVLGVMPAATDDEMRQAFRALAKRWHPDHFATATPEQRARAEHRMRDVLAAYEVLGNAERRRAYDRRHEEETAVPLTFRHDVYHPPGSADPTAAYMYERRVYPADRQNGAGTLFGTLCLMLAVALGGRTLLTPGGGWGAFVALVAIVVLVALAAVLFTDDSVLARAANAFLEHEPPTAPHAYATRRVDYVYDTPPSSPADHPADISPRDFEQFVDDALATVPNEFHDRMENLVVWVEDEPSDETLRSAGVPAGYTLLGLYHGVPLTSQGSAGAGPEVISIYRGPIERHCGGDPERVREQVRATTLHELAHHFGIDHDDMPDWVK